MSGQIEALEMERLYQQTVLNQQSAGRQLSNLWGETHAQIDLTKLLFLGQIRVIRQYSIIFLKDG